jgi:hypothetical protein
MTTSDSLKWKLFRRWLNNFVLFRWKIGIKIESVSYDML